MLAEDTTKITVVYTKYVMSHKHPITDSFAYAIDGIATAIKEEPNFRLHLLAATIVTTLAWYLKFSSLEWVILVLVISSVIVLELINTALEALVDLVSPSIKNQAKTAKDVCSASVLVASIAATVIGYLLFIPKLALVL